MVPQKLALKLKIYWAELSNKLFNHLLLIIKGELLPLLFSRNKFNQEVDGMLAKTNFIPLKWNIN